jgi:ribonucleoside-diphosphate reductase beta chain
MKDFENYQDTNAVFSEKYTSSNRNLFHSPKIFKPFKYPWAYDAWKMQQQMHWIFDEVPMADDLKDWKTKLTFSEQNLCTQIFRFFTQADVEVQDCYLNQYMSSFKPVEVKMMLAAFANMETIHVAAYAHLIDTIGMPEEIYAEFLNYKQMRDKCDYLNKFHNNTIRDLALTLGVYGAFVEGVQLFASFAILLNFQRFGKMKGMGQIIAWSVRDETLHTINMGRLFRELINENMDLWTSDFRKELYQACDTAVYFEDGFIDLAFEVGDNVEGITVEEVKLYIRYIADRRLVQLGLKPKYLIQKNPLPWMDYILNGLEFTNFFENRATEYTRGGTKGTWDEAFTIHDSVLGILGEEQDDNK